MLHLAICDDNINELSNMIKLINLYRTERNFNCEYAMFPNGFDLISTIEKGKLFDVYLLDIIMPGFMGIEVAKEIRQRDKYAPIIFLTSSPEFAVDSYSVRAINYVIKPISKEKFFLTIDELVEKMTFEKEEVLIVKSNEGIQKIVLSNLLFAEVIGRSIFYHLISGKIIECLESFKLVGEKLLEYPYFIKTHRSYIVNMQYIDCIDNQQITLQNEKKIPIAQGKSREIKQIYLDYQMEGD